jgi:NAD(P)-dependent dehydrogenase (short-subunit alcohol dehydrogenase family)
MDLERRGARVLALLCDVSDQGSVAALVAQATAAFGRIDIVINNAGIIQVGPFDTMRVEDFERAMAINFWGAVYTTFAVLPQMRARRRGQITSIGGKVSLPHLLPYDCAKFAMVALSEGLHTELAQHGIHVTTVVPGLMRTGSPANALFKGEQGNEFGWFSIASATPVTAISARRAARRIVAATRRREAEVTLTVQAKLLRALQGVAPGAVQRILSLVNRALPDAAPEQTAEARGMELSTPLSPSALTALMNHAARDTHQYEGTARPTPRHANRVGLGNGSRAASSPRSPQ